MERMNDMENKAKISVFGAGKMGTGIALQFAAVSYTHLTLPTIA